MVKIVFSSFFGGSIDDGSYTIDHDYGIVETMQEARYILDKSIPDTINTMTLTERMYSSLASEYFFE